MSRGSGLALVVAALGAFASCAGTHGPQDRPSTTRTVACTRQTRKVACSAFEDAGFVEAYVDFVLATPSEIAAAFPNPAPGSDPRAEPDTVTLERSDATREILPTLTCFSITDQELDALGDALGMTRPTPLERPSPEKMAAMFQRFTGRAVPARQFRASRPPLGTFLKHVAIIPAACLTVYQLPESLLARLESTKDLDQLGIRWTEAIAATGPNPGAYTGEESYQGPDARADASSWKAIVRDVATFARRRHCDGRKLYVKIEYDC